MTAEQLLKLAEAGEDSFTEFKEDIKTPDTIVPEICAFANARGGRILLGVNDDGKVSGVVKDWTDELSNWATTKIDPPFEEVTIEKVIVENKKVIVIEIPAGAQKPYANLKKGSRDYWVRFGANKRKATYEDLCRLYQASMRLSGDEIPIPGSSKDDLDMGYFSKFFRRFFGRELDDESQSGSAQEMLLENMRIAKDGNLTTSGLLLFGNEPQKFLPYCKIWGVSFKGTNTAEGAIIDKREIEGKLNEQIEDAEIFVKKHINLMVKIKNFDREEKYELPVEALREAIVNAVAHRDYMIRSNIRIFIFDDRVEIISPGGLPNSVTLENIRYGIHVERNPIIISYLAKFRKMEQIGFGIPRMIAITQKETKHEPLFSLETGEFKVTFTRPKLHF